MAFKLNLVAAVATLFLNVNGSPIEPFGSPIAPVGRPIEPFHTIRSENTATAQASAEEYLATNWILAPPAQCAGQSCLVADTAGSTGKLPAFKAEGGTTVSWKCIEKWNPEGAAAGQKAPPVKKQSTGVSSTLLGGLNSATETLSSPTIKGTFNSKCTKNIVLFAKGTMEPGALGMLVGPSVQSALKGDWSVVGIPYTADIPGDYCLGLPGGQVGKDMLNQAAEKCPNSAIFLSGYSQGAMVAHNSVAYAKPSAIAHVAGVVVFGDPFQGAKIKGYNGEIVTFCNAGDNVCTGNFEIAPSHLSYSGGSAVSAFNRLASAYHAKKGSGAPAAASHGR
jgi:hypothetical protein